VLVRWRPWSLGAAYLRKLGHSGSVLVVACDLPLVNEAVFRMLADWPGTSSVVPIIEGVRNPLCARWSPATLLRPKKYFRRDFGQCTH
jgi:molybdopterin-guanine dinucleotide biosynthesis protein A